VLVPQRAVTVTPQGVSVLVVGANNIAETRAVTLGPLQGSTWVIQSGLAAGDRVIVDGGQKAQQANRCGRSPPRHERALLHRPPIFSWGIALAIILAGGLALLSLPIEQSPSIAPPSLAISVTYPGRRRGGPRDQRHAGHGTPTARRRSTSRSSLAPTSTPR
jgi:hypothetical protein